MQNRMGPPAQRPGQQTALKAQQKQEPSKMAQVSQLMESHKDQIQKALPKHLTPERLARICLTELRKSEKLQKCDAMSFMGAVIQAAQLGLEPGAALGECYLIPYGKEATLQIGYRGKVKLAMQSGSVASVEVRTVYEGDTFEVELGTDSKIVHKPDFTARRTEGKAYYAVIKTKGGGVIFDIMGRAEMDLHRKKFTSDYSDAWQSSYDEMAKKTVLHRALKLVPQSPELALATSMEDGQPQENHKVIDADYHVPEDVAQPEKWAELASGDKQREDADRRVAMAMLNSSVSQAISRKVNQGLIDTVFDNMPIPDWELDATVEQIHEAVQKLNALKVSEVKP